MNIELDQLQKILDNILKDDKQKIMRLEIENTMLKDELSFLRSLLKKEQT